MERNAIFRVRSLKSREHSEIMFLSESEVKHYDILHQIHQTFIRFFKCSRYMRIIISILVSFVIYPFNVLPSIS